MKVGIIQSNYIPWRGYFDFIDDVDLFIFHDDLQYTKNDWRNRNKIKTNQGAIWITVPVNYNLTSQLISETRIDYSHNWVQKHINQFEQWYAKAPFYRDYSDELFGLLTMQYQTISKLNITFCRWVMEKLGIKTPTRLSSAFQAQGTKTTKIVNLLKIISANFYLSGPTAKGYLNESLFRENSIGLEYKSYDYPAYPQLWGEFISEVTVLDLLFNTGPEARNYLKSRSPNQLAVAI